jgi:hypothetical protein
LKRAVRLYRHSKGLPTLLLQQWRLAVRQRRQPDRPRPPALLYLLLLLLLAAAAPPRSCKMCWGPAAGRSRSLTVPRLQRCSAPIDLTGLWLLGAGCMAACSALQVSADTWAVTSHKQLKAVEQQEQFRVPWLCPRNVLSS